MTRRLALEDLRAIVTDLAELAKGARVFDEGGLVNLSRHGDSLYADAPGAMAAPYKVTITLGDTVRARCTCMAARSRPYCKHAAALLIAWARQPEAFLESEGPPPGTERKRASVKRGKADARALMSDGVARVGTLVRELAASGVAAGAEGKGDALRGLAEGLRAGRLRRLSSRVHGLADLLDDAEASRGHLATGDYADVLADLLLTARKLDKHLGGEPLDDRHVEELIGKTWRKTDRTPIAGLDLLEYGYRQWTTADDFVVREARFLDVASGTHYTEKQILPAFLARRTPARPSRAGFLLVGSAGSVYPGYPPRRLDLESPGESVPLGNEALTAAVASAIPGLAAALAAFQDHRKDLFAPDELPVAVRVPSLLADGPRLRAVDADGAALHLPDDAGLVAQLAAALRGAELRALIGDLGLDLALPTLVPRAAIVARGGALELRPLASATDLAALAARRRQARRARVGPRHDWADQARAAGASSAAVSLAEIRGEIADLLAQGLASFTPRATEASAARLRELGLGSAAQLLDAIAARPDPEARLDDVVRLYQVLAVALLRLVGTTRVDRDRLVSVPTWPSVLVPAPSSWLAVDEVMRRRAGAGPDRLDRWTAAVHVGHALAAMPPEALAPGAGGPTPLWADSSLGPLVAEALTAHGRAAIPVARAVLAPAARAGRAARMTAIRTLVAIDPDEATDATAELLDRGDPALHAFAREQIDAAAAARGDAAAVQRRRERRRVIAEMIRLLLGSADGEARARAALALGDMADALPAGPALREAWPGVSAAGLREAAAIALGRLGDAEMIDAFIAALEARADDDRRARAAAMALGHAGDARGVAALIEAFASSWRSQVVGEALGHAAGVALVPLIERIESQPQLAARKASADTVARLPGDDVAAHLVARLADASDDDAPRLADVYLDVTRPNPVAHRAVAAAVLARVPESTDKAIRSLRRAASRAVASDSH